MTTKKKPSKASRLLREKGLTLRSAAEALGVNNSHLYRVLAGERESISLLERFSKLPAREVAMAQ